MSELKDALLQIHNWQRDHSWNSARLGRDNGDGTYTIRVANRPGWVHVRLGANGKGGAGICL